MIVRNIPRVITFGLVALALGVGAAHPSATRANVAYRTVNLRAEAVTRTGFTVRWDANLGAVTPSHMLQTNANQDGVWSTRPLSRTEVEDRVLRFADLEPLTTYRVRILDCVTVCLYTSSVDVTTLPPPPPPAAPTNLHLCGSGPQPELCQGSGLRFRWTDNATTEDRYEFQWAQGQPGTLPRASAYSTVMLGPDRTGYVFSPTGGGYTYFRVRSCNTTGCSAFSNLVTRSVLPQLSAAP